MTHVSIIMMVMARSLVCGHCRSSRFLCCNGADYCFVMVVVVKALAVVVMIVVIVAVSTGGRHLPTIAHETYTQTFVHYLYEAKCPTCGLCQIVIV